MTTAERVTANADDARAYLHKRGLVDDRVIRSARLTLKGGRVRFPWFDDSGVEVYTTGRSLNGAQPKYKHQDGERPPLYASPGAWESERVALVEGQMDAIACAQGGTSAFATSGSSLSDEAIAILRRKTEVVFVPDADEAGERLAAKVREALAGHVRLFQATLPEGCKDIAEVAERADDPGEAVAEILGRAEIVEPEWQTSWQPDVSDHEDGPPQLLTRSDGAALLYEGRCHWFQGEPESGKTWAAQVAVAQVLSGGGVALFLDFEDSRASVVSRLHAMGADTGRLIYVRPNEPLTGGAVSDVERLMARRPALVVLDGVAEAMALHGLDPIRSLDVATFMHEVVDRFRSPSSTMVVIDHVARGDAGKTRYAYGSQHKLASVDGAAYRFEVLQVFSREQGGAARIDVVKDRPGFVRSIALDKVRAGVLRVVPGDELRVTIEPPEIPTSDEEGLSYSEGRVMAVLDEIGKGLTYSGIGDLLASDGKGRPLKRTTIQKALDGLIEQGLADGSRSEGGSRSTFWRVSE